MDIPNNKASSGSSHVVEEKEVEVVKEIVNDWCQIIGSVRRSILIVQFH